MIILAASSTRMGCPHQGQLASVGSNWPHLAGQEDKFLQFRTARRINFSLFVPSWPSLGSPRGPTETPTLAANCRGSGRVQPITWKANQLDARVKSNQIKRPELFGWQTKFGDKSSDLFGSRGVLVVVAAAVKIKLEAAKQIGPTLPLSGRPAGPGELGELQAPTDQKGDTFQLAR